MQLKKEHITFEAAWKGGVARLVKIATHRIKKKQNLNGVLGVECSLVKPREDEEDEKATHVYTMPSLCTARML